MINFEFYETPDAFVRWLFRELAHLRSPIIGTAFEPCVGDGAIIKAAALRPQEFGVKNHWMTNDLDPRWPADFHLDARARDLWLRTTAFLRDTGRTLDWTVANPPFTPALDIITAALEYSRIGVAMHLRASIHEVLKTGNRRTWMATHTPTGILWLPRFAYQRSKTTGKWTTDSVCACWVVWLKDPLIPQFIRYAPESVIDELDAFTQAYRERMDRIMAERLGALEAMA
jgi:hypothetical protein